MQEKKELLKQLGWSEKLIEGIFSPDYIPLIEPFDFHNATAPSETSSTNLSLGIQNPIITSGIYFSK